MAFLKRLAMATGRTRADTKTMASARNGQAMRLLYLMLLAALLGLFLPAFVQQFAKWNGFRPDTLIPSDIWRVFYKDAKKTCGNDVTSDVQCPGSPAATALWTSPYKQRDPLHKSRLISLGPSGYWIGAVIPVSVLHDARIRRANQLLLGWVLASYRIWIDGKLELGGAGNKDQHPIIIPISPARLSEPKPLYVAIEVMHDSEYGMPDFLNSLRGGEGFVTPESASTFRDFVMFWETVRPFSLLITYMVIGSLFFSFWLTRRSKSEYFYMALFALASAFYQARMTSIFSSAVSRTVTADLDMILRFYIASFALALGLSFARARLAYFRYGAPLALVLPLLLSVALPDNHSKHLLAAFGQNWATPIFYLLAGVICFIQACHLYTERKPALPLPTRVRRLALVAGGFVALAVFYILQINGLIPGIMRVMWMGMGFDHFVSVVFFGTVMLAEYREQESAPLTVIASHRPLLPAGLSGSLLATRLNCPTWLHSVLKSHFQTAVLKNDGAVIEREGELLAFFEREAAITPELSALRAAEELALDAQLLSDLNGCELGFRSALVNTVKGGGNGEETEAEAWLLLETVLPVESACAVILSQELARKLLKQAPKFTVPIYSSTRVASVKKLKLAA